MATLETECHQAEMEATKFRYPNLSTQASQRQLMEQEVLDLAQSGWSPEVLQGVKDIFTMLKTNGTACADPKANVPSVAIQVRQQAEVLAVQQRHEQELQDQIKQTQLLNAQKAQYLQQSMTEAMAKGSSECMEQIRLAAVEQNSRQKLEEANMKSAALQLQLQHAQEQTSLVLHQQQQAIGTSVDSADIPPSPSPFAVLAITAGVAVLAIAALAPPPPVKAARGGSVLPTKEKGGKPF